MRKKNPYIIFMCLLCSIKLLGQQNKIDSLQKLLLIAKEDTGKVNTLNNLALEFRMDNPDTCIYFAKKALNLSEKLNYKIGLAEANLWLGTGYFNLGTNDKALKYLNIAKLITEQLINSSKTNNPRNKTILGRIIHITGLYYHYQGNYTEALKWYTKALQIRKELKDEKGIAGSYNNIGNIYSDQGNYTEALKNHYSSLKINEKLKRLNEIGDSYNNIGIIYMAQGYYEEALKRQLAALKIRKELKNKKQEAISYGNIGVIYLTLKQYADALKNYQEALKIHQAFGDKYRIAITLNDIGKYYSIQGNYSEALNYHFKALQIVEELNYKPEICDFCHNISSVYQKQGDLVNASKYGKNSLALSKEIGIILSTQDASQTLFEIYKKTGKHKEALEMHELYIQSRDSVINEKNQKDILSQQFKYDYDKKALADSLNFVSQKNISDLKNEAEHKIEQNKRYALYAGLFLALIFSIFIFNRFKITAKQKKVIEYQNSQIVESINYSKHIQASLLPSINVMQKALNNLFILYEPKAIVSGDFYWFKDFEKYTILACVDCTGHGVPGGFMSTLGSLLLDKVVNAEQLNPSEILSNLSNEIINVLHQQAGGSIQDGMDLSICLIDKEHHTIEFAGARNGIIVVSNGVAKKYKADLYPVGGSYS